MNKNKSVSTLKAMGIIAIIFGVLYCIMLFISANSFFSSFTAVQFTRIFISILILGAIFGVSLIIGGVKFMELSNVNDKQLLDEKGKILGWTIFFSIALFPIGLFSVFIYSNLEDVEKDNTKTQASVKKDSFEDKVEKIKVLSELKQNGLIDEEEFKTAKGKILE